MYCKTGCEKRRELAFGGGRSRLSEYLKCEEMQFCVEEQTWKVVEGKDVRE